MFKMMSHIMIWKHYKCGFLSTVFCFLRAVSCVSVLGTCIHKQTAKYANGRKQIWNAWVADAFPRDLTDAPSQAHVGWFLTCLLGCIVWWHLMQQYLLKQSRAELTRAGLSTGTQLSQFCLLELLYLPFQITQVLYWGGGGRETQGSFFASNIVWIEGRDCPIATGKKTVTCL